MEKVKLKLLKYWKSYRPGDVVSVPPGVLPERMIRNKTAKRYIPKRISKPVDDTGNISAKKD